MPPITQNQELYRPLPRQPPVREPLPESNFGELANTFSKLLNSLNQQTNQLLQSLNQLNLAPPRF